MDLSWIKNLATKSNTNFANKDNAQIIKERVLRSFDFIMGTLRRVHSSCKYF